MERDMTDPRDVFLSGRGIALRALCEEDLAGNWYGWFNDPEVTSLQNKGIWPNTPERQRAYFDAQQEDGDQLTLAIDANGVHVGNVTLKQIDWVHRTAEIGIVIGEKRHWGTGIGREATRLMTRHALLTLNLNKIVARVFAGNDRALKTLTRIGYRVEGEQVEQFYKNGRFHNVVLVGITASHWKAEHAMDDALVADHERTREEG